MSPEMVERVAEEVFVRALLAVPGLATRERAVEVWRETPADLRPHAHPSDFAIARYALALAERAAREAFSGAEVEPGNLALLAKAAVQRAVEGT